MQNVPIEYYSCRVSVCVFPSVRPFVCAITQKGVIDLSSNMKFEYSSYQNSSDKFDIWYCLFKVKATVSIDLSILI